MKKAVQFLCLPLLLLALFVSACGSAPENTTTRDRKQAPASSMPDRMLIEKLNGADTTVNTKFVIDTAQVQDLYKLIYDLPVYGNNMNTPCAEWAGRHYKITFWQDAKELVIVDALESGCSTVAIGKDDRRTTTDNTLWDTLDQFTTQQTSSYPLTPIRYTVTYVAEQGQAPLYAQNNEQAQVRKLYEMIMQLPEGTPEAPCQDDPVDSYKLTFHEEIYYADIEPYRDCGIVEVGSIMGPDGPLATLVATSSTHVTDEAFWQQFDQIMKTLSFEASRP